MAASGNYAQRDIMAVKKTANKHQSRFSIGTSRLSHTILKSIIKILFVSIHSLDYELSSITIVLGLSGFGFSLVLETPSMALNLLAALCSSELEVYISSTLYLYNVRPTYLGTGGHATVETGRVFGERLVAVKHNRILSQPFGMDANTYEFGKHLNQLCIEVRIQAHQRLRAHPNIVNIIGRSIDEYSDNLSLSLVLEYSAFGTLSSFLQTNKAGIEHELGGAQSHDLIVQRERVGSFA
jgi:hypothetical protein